MKALEGRTAVLTGGGGVLCTAIAQGLASAGAAVVLYYLDEEKATVVLERIERDGIIYLVVGGGGRPAYVESLRRQIEQLGLQKRVVLYGPVPHDKFPAVYANAQLTLIPSLCGEGTSLSALESMACGTATICTYVAGLRDLPGPHALPTVTGLVEVMREVYPDRVRVGEEQRKAVLARYSIQVWRRGWQEASASAGLRLK